MTKQYLGDIKQLADKTKTNLLIETADTLERHGKTLDDIVFVGSRDGSTYIPREKIIEVLNESYSDWYGKVEVDPMLTITLNNGDTLIRWNTEGMEGWRYVCSRARENAKVIKSVIGTIQVEE